MDSKYNLKASCFVLRCFLILGIGVGFPVYAQVNNLETVTAKLYALLEEQEFQSAFTLAQQHSDTFEGDAKFDLGYGLAAKSAGHCNLALYPLERVVQLQPTSVEARFALANCYYELGNLQAAKSEFNYLSQLPLSEQISGYVGQFKNAIERRQNETTGGWQNTLQFGLGQDSNPNNGVENEFVSIPVLGQVRLFEQSREVSSSFYNVSGQFSYFSPIDKQSAWFASAGMSYTGFSESLALSRSNLSGLVGYVSQLHKVNWGTRVFYRPLWLDEEHFLDYFGVVGDLSTEVFADSKVGAELTLARLDYAEIEPLTRLQKNLSIWFDTPTFSGQSRISLNVADEQTDETRFDFNSRKITGLSYRLDSQINWQWSYQVAVDYSKIEYDQAHPLFAQIREDTLSQLSVDLYYQWLENWLLNAQVSVTKNASNLDLYEYKRSNVWLGARYQF
ncbi:tetratricopeptide repeat protein [Aliiglaciecola lipolytica]|uniref:Uncharacterized protein n=1 Tax=Aliiglaciecola lipolytica E3 TaxID=1127673 RepID=K6YNT7_9ALTE|nr:tetratricopeptide repeat protein [Aliiglaciecola lipolytica]GAC13015.1 hypothetical protein GLIP_0368 [Aliiglaciecola lipolytica E3]